MTLGELRGGAWFRFHPEQPKDWGLNHVSKMLFQKLGGQSRSGRARSEMMFCLCVRDMDGYQDGGGGWYSRRAVVEVFPCKCCLDCASNGPAPLCPCWHEGDKK